MAARRRPPALRKPRGAHATWTRRAWRNEERYGVVVGRQKTAAWDGRTCVRSAAPTTLRLHLRGGDAAAASGSRTVRRRCLPACCVALCVPASVSASKARIGCGKRARSSTEPNTSSWRAASVLRPHYASPGSRPLSSVSIQALTALGCSMQAACAARCNARRCTPRSIKCGGGGARRRRVCSAQPP
jgi:hypothetical protein